MKLNSKNLLFVLSVVVFLCLAFFAINSRKAVVVSDTNKTTTTPGEVEESKEDEVSEISLEITSPKDGDIVGKSPVTVTGVTVPGADVFVNDTETKSDKEGDFKVSLSLEEGENELFVVVNDSEGNYAESSVKITLNTE